MGTHVVSASWSQEPKLLVRNGDQESTIPLQGKFSWDVLEGKTCIGHGGPCPRQAQVGQWNQCRQCDPLESPDCIFEPQCKNRPETCHCPFGIVPHIVYIAMYGTLPKVGMTQERRVETRLLEQGADGYFVLKRTENRAEARKFESFISFSTDIPEFRSHKATIPLLHKPQSFDKIGLAAEEQRARFASHEPEPFISLPSPVQPLPGPVHRVQTAGKHEGTWLGAKGKYLFYEAKKKGGMLDVGLPRINALSRSDLEGRFISGVVQPSQ